MLDGVLSKIGLVCLSLVTQPSYASKIQGMNPYQSGRQLRQKFTRNPGAPIRSEFGGYIEAPLDYRDPGAGTISIYYHTVRPFDAKKPTFIFFQGGPGESSHLTYEDTFRNLTRWNIVLLDYRGIAFSYPDTLEDLEDTSYFSTEFVARDAFEVLRKLGVRKASVYGHSYGTAVATVFSSLFSDHVQAVVLEGTIFSGDQIWNSQYRRGILQSVFDGLPHDARARILRIGALAHAPGWFAKLGHTMMLESNFKASFIRKLHELLSRPEREVIAYVQALSNDSNENLFDSDFSSGHFFYHIACKELNLTRESSHSSFIFMGSRLVPPQTTEDLETCNSLRITKSDVKTYHAIEYPLWMPVTYFQGSADGATPADHASRHFKQVARGFAQLFLASNQGHSPLQDLLTAENAGAKAGAEILLSSALEGRPLSPGTFEKLRGNDFPDWQLISKLAAHTHHEN